jgi:RHS repeat-associated protein
MRSFNFSTSSATPLGKRSRASRKVERIVPNALSGSSGALDFPALSPFPTLTRIAWLHLLLRALRVGAGSWRQVCAALLIPAYLNLALPVVPLFLLVQARGAESVPAPTAPGELKPAPEQATPPKAEPPPVRIKAKVTVNKRLPASVVTAADRAKPRELPDNPNDAELARAAGLAEPLVPSHVSGTKEDNAALATAIRAHAQSDDPADFEAFLAAHPTSRWAASLWLNLGLDYFHTGWFSKAFTAFEKSWTLGKSATSGSGIATANRAVAELMRLNARVGRADVIETLDKEIAGRTFAGRAKEYVAGAREGLHLMREHPGMAFLCGPAALTNLYHQAHPGESVPVCVREAQSTPQGFALTSVLKLAHTAGMELQMVRREPGAVLVAPAVVHWKIGHYSALLSQENGVGRCEDPTFGSPDTHFTIGLAAFDAEASGYMLVPVGPLPPGYAAVSAEEGQKIWGRGLPSDSDSTRTAADDLDTPTAPCVGMMAANSILMVVSLKISDAPLHYTAPVGPAVEFKFTYNQREASQPTTIDYGSVGHQWTHNFLSFIDETRGGSVGAYTYSPVIRLPGGGTEVYVDSTSTSATDLVSYTFPKQIMRQSVLVKKDAMTYERHNLDGTVLVYGYRTGSAGSRRYFLTQIFDESGNQLVLSYDMSDRLVAITDEIGQVTTLDYEDMSDSLLLTKVTDPFGRYCTLTYDGSGRLTSITDVLGLTSTVTYDSSSTFINSLVTAYGTSTFSYGESGSGRWLTMTDPLGQTERLEYRLDYEDVPGVGALPDGMDVTDANIRFRNTFYWDKKAQSEHPGDYTAAHIYHWLHTASGEMSGNLESEKSPLESSRTFYNYIGQPDAVYDGTTILLTAKGRVLSDDSSAVTQYDYDMSGTLTDITDPLGRKTTYVDGVFVPTDIRQKTGSSTYELLEHRSYFHSLKPTFTWDAAGEKSSFLRNARGQMIAAVDPKGVTTVWTYDSDGYLQRIDTLASGITVIYLFDGDVYGVGALPGDNPSEAFDDQGTYIESIDPTLCDVVKTTSFTYDAYGRVETVTDSDGYTVTTDYDDFDRPTTITYPDSTYQQIVYDRLDAVKTRDRLGRWTETTYNAVRQPIMVRDALNRRTLYQWCSCGNLAALTDPLGRTTSWSRDLQGRVTAKHYPDGSRETYAYNAVDGRLNAFTDAKGQVTNYSYNTDGSIASIAYDNAEVSTPSVSYTYDTYYPRMATMADAVGTTTYVYNSITGTPTLGAGRLASIDGPLGNDEITYTYDELGRVASQAIDGISNEADYEYDDLGRLITVTNPLGEFDYAYVNATNRLDHVEYPNGQVTNYTYYNNAGDQRLHEIENLTPSPSNLSKFTYTYDANGTIQSWAKKWDGGSTLTSNFKYDAADQLTDAEVPGSLATKNYTYRYDISGNRTSEQIDLAVETATHNRLNQLTTLSDTGPIRFAGTLNEPASVTVNGVSADVDGANRFTADVVLDPGMHAVGVVATDGSSNVTTNTYDVTVASGSSRTLQYDANGNLLDDGNGRVFTWYANNQLASISENGDVTEFVYDGNGRRVQEKLNSTLIKQWVWADGAQPAEERNASNVVTKHFYGQGEQIGGTPYFFTMDHLGSIREMTDDSGVVQARYEYDPYGRRTKLSGSLDADLGFTGFLYHAGTGLSLALYRVYDPDLGRWLSRDPSGDDSGANLYAYVGGNPINALDPLGLCGTSSQTKARGQGLPSEGTTVKIKPTEMYGSRDDAARAALEIVNPMSISGNVEYGGYVVKRNSDGKYGYTQPTIGGLDGVTLNPDTVPTGSFTVVGDYHTHGNYSDKQGNVVPKSQDSYDADHFSPTDTQGNDKNWVKDRDEKVLPKADWNAGYLGTPSGGIYRYSPGIAPPGNVVKIN